MTNEQYQKEILPNLPDHMSDKFIDYLRDKNVVVEETDTYIAIENIKYHTPERPWITLFLKDATGSGEGKVLEEALKKYDDWTMVRWKASERSIKRSHLHFFKNGVYKYT